MLSLTVEGSIAKLLLSPSALCGACTMIFRRHAPRTCAPGPGVSSHETPAFPLRAFHFTYLRARHRAR